MLNKRGATVRYWREPRALAVWCVLVAIALWRAFSGTPTEPPPPRLDEGTHAVRRVVDGDTLLLESGARVRLLGVDAPESVREGYPVDPWGPEASNFTKQFIAHAGNRVRLAFDLERIDRHDRYLAYVWSGDALLNEEIVRAGLAEARPDYRYSAPMKRRLRRAQEEARRAGRGIWSNQAAPNGVN